jgi:copper(I)-binding protein
MRTMPPAAALAALIAITPVAAHHVEDHEHDLFCDCEILAEAGDLLIADGMARAAGAMARSGAGYFTVTNAGDAPDRLLSAESPAAVRVELHAHELDAAGVARMVELADGIAIPPGETVVLEPGGLHVMFLGLTEAWDIDAGIPLTLVFESAGPVEVSLPAGGPARHDQGHAHDHGEDHGHGHEHGHGHLH